MRRYNIEKFLSGLRFGSMRVNVLNRAVILKLIFAIRFYNSSYNFYCLFLNIDCKIEFLRRLLPWTALLV